MYSRNPMIADNEEMPGMNGFLSEQIRRVTLSFGNQLLSIKN